MLASPELSPNIPHRKSLICGDIHFGMDLNLRRREQASLSRPMQPTDEPPTLYHSLQQKNSSVLCLAADGDHIYSGSQGDDINASGLTSVLRYSLSIVEFRYGTRRLSASRPLYEGIRLVCLHLSTLPKKTGSLVHRVRIKPSFLSFP